MAEGAAVHDASWVPPNRFTRDTTKFWLKSEDVIRFKLQLIQHLPVLIYDRKSSPSGISQTFLKIKAEGNIKADIVTKTPDPCNSIACTIAKGKLVNLLT